MLLLRSQVRRHLWSIPRKEVHSTTFRLKTGPDIGLEEGALQVDRTGIFDTTGCVVDKPTKLGCYFIIRDMCSVREAFSATPSPSPKSTSPDVPSHEELYQSSMESAFRRYLPRTSSSAILGEEAREDASRSSSWRKISYAAGAGAASVLILVGVVAGLSSEEGSVARTRGLLLSTWSILWDKLGGFAEGVGMVLGDGIRDAFEAWSATAALARCLASVLVTVSEEPTVGLSSWLKPGVATLVADVAAQGSRRKAVVEAGGGRVVDWLLKAVASVSDGTSLVTQAEASRALAHLLTDDTTCERVLSRPHALPCLFQFASALHVKQSDGKDLFVDGTASTGRSMLVTAIMDHITSSCDVDGRTGLKPNLPGNADPGDIAIALQVIKDGGFLSDDQDRNGTGSAGKAGDDKGGGVHGIGIKVMGGTGIVGMQRVRFKSSLSDSKPDGRHDLFPIASHLWRPTNALLDAHGGYVGHAFTDSGHEQEVIGIKRAAVTEYRRNKYGLWDDLQGRHITVPLAAWALAMWARASNANRTKIAELDENGNALLGAVLAPEKTVKWHGAMAMRSLLSSKSYSLDTDVAVRWSSALLMVAEQAGLVKDPSLAHSTLAALTGCVSRSKSAHALVLQEGLPVMRKIACELGASSHVQEVLAQVLDVLTAGEQMPSIDESKKWAAILLRWVCNSTTDTVTRSCGSKVLLRVVDNLGLGGIPVSQAWLAMLLMDLVSDGRAASAVGNRTSTITAEAKEREQLQNQIIQAAVVAAGNLAKVVAQEGVYRPDISGTGVQVTESAAELPILDLLGLYGSDSLPKAVKRDSVSKVTAIEAADAVRKAVKALTELTAEDPTWRQRILEAGVLHILRRLLLCKDYEQWAASETSDSPEALTEQNTRGGPPKKGQEEMDIEVSVCPQIRKHAARLLSALTLQPAASAIIAEDQAWVAWLEDCADGKIEFSNDMKTRSYASTSLLNISSAQSGMKSPRLQGSSHGQKNRVTTGRDFRNDFWPRYEDSIFIMNSGSVMWKAKHVHKHQDQSGNETRREMKVQSVLEVDSVHTIREPQSSTGLGDTGSGQKKTFPVNDEPVMDVIFIHGLRGGPFKTWRLADSKTSTTTPLVEKIDVDAGKKGTCWPQEWLAHDLPRTRLLSVKYKTNLSEWSGATLPLQEVSSMLLDKLLAAGVGERPLVFVTHSLGGLVVKQMLLLAGTDETKAHIVNQTAGTVFYSCPHFGSKLADVPWRFGYIIRPAPSIGELRSGSPKLEELNRCLRQLHKEGRLDVLSFSETKVTPLVEGYGGWGFRMEVVPIESAYPGFGELVVLPGTDHVNSCKPLDRADPAYTKTLEFLKKLEVEAMELAQCD